MRAILQLLLLFNVIYHVATLVIPSASDELIGLVFVRDHGFVLMQTDIIFFIGFLSDFLETGYEFLVLLEIAGFMTSAACLAFVQEGLPLLAVGRSCLDLVLIGRDHV